MSPSPPVGGRFRLGTSRLHALDHNPWLPALIGAAILALIGLVALIAPLYHVAYAQSSVTSQIVANSGHWLMEEQPKSTLAAITAFIGKQV